MINKTFAAVALVAASPFIMFVVIKNGRRAVSKSSRLRRNGSMEFFDYYTLTSESKLLESALSLFNVIKGDVNIVGPAPLTFDEYMRLKLEVYNRQALLSVDRRFNVLPGVISSACFIRTGDDVEDSITACLADSLYASRRKSAIVDFKIVLYWLYSLIRGY